MLPDNSAEYNISKHIDNSLRNWMLKFVILNRISRKESYPYDLYKKLREANLPVLNSVRKSEVYNVLNSLESIKLVEAELKVSGKRIQKKYHITKEGAAVNLKTKLKMKKNISNIKALMDYESV